MRLGGIIYTTMKTAYIVGGLIIIVALGYYFFMQPATPADAPMTGSETKIDINAACEGALAYMTFTDGAAAEAFVQECKEGKHPEVIEQYKRQMGIPSDTSAMRAEENMIVVMEQRPGNTVTASQVYLAAPGFIAIHEDANGTAGAIIGSSALLQAGESSQIEIQLSRSVRDGEKLHAMLHNDTNANGIFNANTDLPVASRLGGSIQGWFEISSQAPENVPITI